MAPRVSVIIASHNYAHYLGDALDSVLAQTFGDWECIVADDGSTDNTADIVAAYTAREPRIRYLPLPHGGVSKARNAAIAVSTGDLIQFLDADDKLAPFKLQQHVRFMDAHPETAVVYADVAYFRTDEPDVVLQSPQGKLSKSIFGDRVHGAREAVDRFEHFNFVHLASILMRRDALLETGLFETTVWGPEDWDVWMSCAIQGGRFDHSMDDAPVALIRTHRASTSSTRGRVLRGLIAAAKAFPSRPAAKWWTRDTLPLIYEVALGLDEAEHGQHRRGARRIWRAAGHATESLTALRWRVYAIAAWLLPGRAFFWFASMPIPEQALEMYRRFRRLIRHRP